MPYVLGIDIGGTRTSAAVARLRGASWSRPEVVRLDPQSHTVPSVLHVSANGSLTVGDPSLTGALVDGGRIARGFVQRIGDDVPLMVAGEACRPQTLAAVLAMWVVELVLGQEGEQPEHIVLSHPASWGPYRKELLHEALWEIGLANVTLLPEPVAAAESHAARGNACHTLGVYALGGDGFATSVVRQRRPAGFELLSCLEAVAPLGGADFDEALVEHIRAQLTRELGARQLEDPQVRLALFELRGECARAKERLTAATETDVLLRLPQGPKRVPITRTEFEAMIRPALELTVDTLARTVGSTGVPPDQLDGILLVGGSAQIPLVRELVAARFPIPVTVEADPQVTAAAGAALAACQIVSTPAGGRHDPDWSRQPAAIGYPDGAQPGPPQQRPDRRQDEGPEPPPRPPVRITPLKLRRTASGSRLIPGRSLMASGLAVLAIGVAAVLAFAYPPEASLNASSSGASRHASASGTRAYDGHARQAFSAATLSGVRPSGPRW
jgi:molecular chaperone DnaK (HSP70)